MLIKSYIIHTVVF